MLRSVVLAQAVAVDGGSPRYPLQRIGTPYEDAMRRDFTVNSLFYNVTRGVVEDFVGKVPA